MIPSPPEQQFLYLEFERSVPDVPLWIFKLKRGWTKMQRRGHIPCAALSTAKLHPAKVDAREDDEGEERVRNVRQVRLKATLQQVSRRRGRGGGQ